MTINKRALILVDMSVEQVEDLHYQKAAVIDKCRQLVSSCRNKEDTGSVFDLVIDSRLWLSSPEDCPSLARVWPNTGTGLFVAGSQGAGLIDELQKISKHHLVTFSAKYNYSCFANGAGNNQNCQLPSLLEEHEISEVYIAGINTDYCVFATALDAFQWIRPSGIRTSQTSRRDVSNGLPALYT